MSVNKYDKFDFWVLTIGLVLFFALCIGIAHCSTCFLPEGCNAPTVTRATDDMLIIYRGHEVVAASLDGYVCVGTADAPNCHRAIPVQDAMEGIA
jgi:hypothetical protein